MATASKLPKLPPLALDNTLSSGTLFTAPRRQTVRECNEDSVRDWINNNDVKRLEHFVIAGKGDLLLKEISCREESQNFLQQVPQLMKKVDELLTAAASGDTGRLKLLLEDRRYIRARDRNGWGLLHCAVAGGHVAMVEFLVTNYPEVLRLRDSNGETAANMARDYGASSVIMSTLKQAELAHRKQTKSSRQQRTNAHQSVKPLFNGTHQSKGPGSLSYSSRVEAREVPHAKIRTWIHSRRVDQLERLLVSGQGQRLLNETAASSRVVKFLQSVRPMMIKMREIHQAAISGELEKVRVLIGGRACLLEACDRQGLNIAHKAAGLGHVPLLNFLLEESPRSVLESRDFDGRTALHWSTAAAGYSCYEQLVAAGADEAAEDNFGHIAPYYRRRPQELGLFQLRQLPDAPRAALPACSTTSQLARTSTNTKLQGAEGSERAPAASVEGLSDDHQHQHHQQHHQQQQQLPRNTRKRLLHEAVRTARAAVRSGDLSTVRSLAASWGLRLLRCQDSGSTSLLHTAASHGQLLVAKFLLQALPSLALSEDQDGRLPIHFAAMYVREGGSSDIYTLLEQYGAGSQAEDKMGRQAVYYLTNDKAGVAADSTAVAHDVSSSDTAAAAAATTAAAAAATAATTTAATTAATTAEEEASQPDQTAAAKTTTTTTTLSTIAETPPDNNNNNNESGGGGGGGGQAVGVDKCVSPSSAEYIEDMVLNGRGYELSGLTSDNTDIQDLLNTVPLIVRKIEVAHVAAESGDLSNIKAAVDRTKLATSRLIDGATVLHRAARGGHIDVLRYIVRRFPETINCEDNEGRTALHYAAARAKTGAYTVLISAGADENIRDQSGRRPADYLNTGHTLLLRPVRQLTRSRDMASESDGCEEADTYDFTEEVISPDVFLQESSEQLRYLLHSVFGALRESLLLLCESRPQSPLIYLALLLYRSAFRQDKLTRLPTLQRLIQMKDSEGRTVLHLLAAVPRDHAGTLFKLLQTCPLAAADRNRDGLTPREVASAAVRWENVTEIDRWLASQVCEENIEILEDLVLKGFGDLEDIVSSLPFDSGSRQQGDTEPWACHIRSGINEHLSEWKRTSQALFDAVTVGSLAHVRQLLGHPRLVTARDHRGRGCLHLAVMCRRGRVVQFLLDLFPEELESEDHMHRTPLHYAYAVENNEQIASQLAEAGADANHTDLLGLLPRHYAEQRSELCPQMSRGTAEFAQVVDHFVSV